MASLLPYLGVAGLILGPSGVIWAVLNWRTDDTGKRISQTGEIVVMLQTLIRELETALSRAEERLRESEAETEHAEALLVTCHARCEALQLALDAVRSELARLQSGGAT